MMNNAEFLADLVLGEDGVYGYEFLNTAQQQEQQIRLNVADKHDKIDYLKNITKHHSVPVMDKEVRLFLKKIPSNGKIIDVGGCWGWHWRSIRKIRPDVTVYIIDFVRENLLHAKRLLGDLINQSIFLIHGDATNLKFKDSTFDGYWSVQVLQHIPDFSLAIQEASRVLKSRGVFANYSFNNACVMRGLTHWLGKKYYNNEMLPVGFYLARASQEQLNIIKNAFHTAVKKRYSEILFKPEFGLTRVASEKSWLGKVDAMLSMSCPVFASVARQQSYHLTKQ